MSLFINELLTDAGHQVVEMSSGLGCEKYLETQLIDCVITDIVMPDVLLETVLRVLD